MEKSLGELLVEARTKRRWSWNRTARHFGLAGGHLYKKWELGTVMEPRHLPQIAEFLGVSEKRATALRSAAEMAKAETSQSEAEWRAYVERRLDELARRVNP